MARTIAGTLNVPDTGPLANAEIYFVAKRNEATKILQGVTSVITTDGSGVYSQSIEDGYYAVSLRYDDGSGNQLHRYVLGDVFVEAGSTITLNALLAANDSLADPTEAALQQLLADAQQARDEAVAAADSIEVMDSPTDSTAGRLMPVGAFGLGSEGTNTLNTDFNTLPEVVGRTHLPIHLSNTESTNGPPRGTYYYVQHIFHSGSQSNCIQIAWPYRNSSGSERGIFYRTRFSETWSDWSEIFNTTNILGTVLSPDDNLTGSIIERGSNSNGEYTKFADGTMICTKYYSATVDVDVNSGGLYRSLSITTPLPVDFVGSNAYTIPSGGNLVEGVWSTLDSANTTNTFRFRCLAAQSKLQTDLGVFLVAIGRCF